MGVDILKNFVQQPHGGDYGVDRATRLQLVERMHLIRRATRSLTGPETHALLMREILSIPPDVKGDIIECGAFAGASTCSLSLACALVGRRLLVYDSFQGLPDEGPVLHTASHYGYYGYCHKGDYAATLDEVRTNVAQYGDIDVCEFVPGFFNESLAGLDQPLVFGFWDVDLQESTRDCIRYIWPLLVNGSKVYTDDAHDLNICALWFDRPWWLKTLQTIAPGYVGSGCGVHGQGSVGYARKITTIPKDWIVPDWFAKEPGPCPD